MSEVGAATSPFQALGEISPDKSSGLPDTTAGFTPPRFGHEGFAVVCPLALRGVALYPIPVRRPVGSFPASFGRSLALPPLRFPSVLVTKSREDRSEKSAEAVVAARAAKGRTMDERNEREARKGHAPDDKRTA